MGAGALLVSLIGDAPAPLATTSHAHWHATARRAETVMGSFCGPLLSPLAFNLLIPGPISPRCRGGVGPSLAEAGRGRALSVHERVGLYKQRICRTSYTSLSQRGPTLRGIHGGRIPPSRRKGNTHPSPDDHYITSPFALPGAMASGIASRYKTGPRLDTYTVTCGASFESAARSQS